MEHLTHPRAARPQPLDPAHRHRGDRQPATSRAQRRRPARLRGPAARPLPGDRRARSRSAAARPLLDRPRARARYAGAAGAGRLPGHLQPRPRRRPMRGVYQVVVEYTEETVGRLRARTRRSELCRAALADTPLRSRRRAGPAARARRGRAPRARAPARSCRPPWRAASRIRRLTDGSLVQFGWGSRQRRIQAAEIDVTSAIAESIAQDKELTKQLLDAAGVPVPHGPAGRRPRTTPGAAMRGARRRGRRQAARRQPGQGRRRSTSRRASISRPPGPPPARSAPTCWSSASSPATTSALLVVGGKLVAAARRDPPHVIGDGVHTVRELVDEVNRDPRRGEGHATVAHPDPPRRDRAGAPRRSRATAPTRFRRAARACCCATTRTSAPAAPRPTSPTTSTRRWRRARSRRRRPSASTSAVSTSSARTSCSPARGTGRRHRRGQRRAGPAHAPRAVVRQGPAGRRSDHRARCSPTATTGASRSSPSPAPTARPPPCG